MLKCAVLLLACAVAMQAADPSPIPLWPKLAPGEKGNIGPERDPRSAEDKAKPVGGRPIAILGDVGVPSITLYRPPKEKDTGASVVVFPGGGYYVLAYDLEGTEVCEWLNSIGVTGVLLKYRVPIRPDQPRYLAPLQDAQRAVGLVRHHAREWGLDAARIGVLGFSAGGHLVAAASTNWAARAYTPVDEADAVSCRPDFAVLVYPAYLTVEKEQDAIAPELKIDSQTPPSLLVQTEDDGVRVESSLFYYLALKRAKVPAEMHLYAKGGHGYGLRPTDNAVTGWPALVERWLRLIDVLKK